MKSERVAARAVTLRRLQESEPGLQLLRKETLPAVAAVLNEHLGGQQRVRTAAEFLESLEGDLPALRDHGFDLPRSAQEYLADWVSARLIIRRPGEGREETVELSPSALAAIRFVSDIEAPRSSVTSSRLTNVADLLSSLARDTNPDPTAYVEALMREKERIERAVAEVDAGRWQPISDSEALERLAEIVHLASEVPGDFARVSEDIESLNKNLREQIIQQAGGRGDILDQIFAGVDDIEDSEAGRSFNAFYYLVLDPEQANAFDEAVDAILSREFALALSDSESIGLRRWLSVLQAESSQVRGVMTGLARNLRRFVESHAFKEHRRLADALAEAKQVVLEASRHVRPQAPSRYELPASSVSIFSLSSWSLYNPSETRVERPIKTLDEQPLDLEELRKRVRLSEIDFDELRRAVSQVLDDRASASIAEILEQHPATQGLASVIGLMVLADAVGMRSPESESLSWRAADGQARVVQAARHIFYEVPDDWRSA
ncbi:MAG: DUF3375 domain-containing protein [Coriobacteriales bacterium]|nr:DUF3375 domain-containing protein [Coriobacteriales bacterium]